MKGWRLLGPSAAALAVAAGCGQILGLRDNYELDAGGTEGGTTSIDGQSDDTTMLDAPADAGDTSDAFDDRGGANDVADEEDGADEGAGDEGPDEEPIDQDAPGDSAVDAAPSPLTIASSNLRLWLTADVGLECVSGRLTKWLDQSGNHRDATLQQSPPQLGPQCGGDGGTHAVHGVDLPYFSAPPNGNVVDETLDVDLTFLVNSEYTIFAVERRWADYPNLTKNASELFFGTTVPIAIEEAGAAYWCGPRPVNETLQMGYVYYTGPPVFAVNQGCTEGLSVSASGVSTPPPGPLREWTTRLDGVLGHELWTAGAAVSLNANTEPLVYAAGGSIGRASLRTTGIGWDERFRGDVAEIVVYGAALSDADRASVEAYLKRHWQY